MNEYQLAKELISTCKYFKIMNVESNNQVVEKKIIDGLNDIIFVENLLNILYFKMKSQKFKKTLDKNRLKKLLIELEKIRLNLEFKGVSYDE